MITDEQTNDLPMTSGVSATFVEACSYTALNDAEIARCCLCAGMCDYIEKAFVFDATFDNDRSTFIYPKLIPTDTLTISILKDGFKVDGISAAYGEIYANDNYEGITIDWFKVKAVFGFGYYSIRCVYESFGKSTTIDSHTYHVLLWSACVANGTVKIESTITGSINKLINFDGKEIYQSTRLDALISKVKPQTEITFYKKTDRTKKQIQDIMIEGYELQTKLLPSEVSNYINRYHILANEIFLTSYNSDDVEQYIKVPVAFKEIVSFKENRAVKMSNFVYGFTDKIEEYVKV